MSTRPNFDDIALGSPDRVLECLILRAIDLEDGDVEKAMDFLADTAHRLRILHAKTGVSETVFDRGLELLAECY